MRPAGAFSGGNVLTFARLMSPFSGGTVSVLVVTEHGLFVDESCTHSAAFATVVAGYLTADRLWRPFDKVCRKAHIEARLGKPFHMTDFLARDQEGRPHPDYAHLNARERDTLIGRLEGAICNTPKIGFIVAVVHSDYEAVFPPDFRKRIRHPYFFGVQAITKVVASWAPDALPRGDKVYCVFESQKGQEDRVRAAYREIANPTHDPHDYLLSDCATPPKRDATQLVAADILANCSGRFVAKPGLTMHKSEDPTCYRLLTNKQLQHRWKIYDRVPLEELRDSMLERGLLPIKKREP